MCNQTLWLSHVAGKERRLRYGLARGLQMRGVVSEVVTNTMGSPTGTVLIVDDDRGCSESIRLVLERDGYEVESADHVDAAVEALSTGKFDIVFCDYRMPDKTGIDLAARGPKAGVGDPRGDDLSTSRSHRRARCSHPRSRPAHQQTPSPPRISGGRISFLESTDLRRTNETKSNDLQQV